jgi:hypothetical protein
MTRFPVDSNLLSEASGLLSHRSEVSPSQKHSLHERFLYRFDRSVAKQAGSNAQQAGEEAGNFNTKANQIYSGLIPGLLRDVNTPTGYTPQEVNNMLVSGGEAVGGVNSGVLGQADLAAARTRNAGGFSNALDEAARVKSRQLASNALQVSGEDARLKQQKQQEARRMLESLYGTNTSDMLKAMGISNEDLQTKLAAGRQGWLQNTLNTIGTLGGVAKNVAGAGKDVGVWG